jgi:hypothetical protein
MAVTCVYERARYAYAHVSAGLVTRSALPWASRIRRPASWATGSPAGSQGARPVTAETAGCPAARNAARAPIEWPTSTTGTAPNRRATSSSTSVRSRTGEASAAFQPRTRNRGRHTTTGCSRTACRMARSMGIIRRMASWTALVGSVLTDSPPCATTTTPHGRRSAPVIRAGASFPSGSPYPRTSTRSGS